MKIKFYLAAAAFAAGMTATNSFAQDTKKSASDKSMPAMSKEQREKMANLHQQMADCLRSDKPMSDCHDMMKKARADMGMMGHEGCGMDMMCDHGHGKGKGKSSAHDHGSTETKE